MSESLSALPFLNLYLRLDETDIPSFRSSEHGNSGFNDPVPEVFHPAVEQFKTAIKAEMQGRATATIEHQGLRCRLSKQIMADGGEWVCARRISEVIPDIKSLGFAPHIYNHLHSLGERDGLIIISGAAANGKTTTAAGLLVDFMNHFGGLAVTIEEPVEFALKGRHGEHGQCFQIEANTDEEWEEALKRIMGWGPRYIFVGEIRTPKTAELLMNAATTGHTVITTFHGGSPEEALTGLLFLAEQAMGDGANDIMAGCLTALMHQTLKEDGPFVKYLFTEENAPADPIRSLIRENKVGMLSTYIDRISARLANQPLPLHNETSKTESGNDLPPLPPIRRN